MRAVIAAADVHTRRLTKSTVLLKLLSARTRRRRLQHHRAYQSRAQE